MLPLLLTLSSLSFAASPEPLQGFTVDLDEHRAFYEIAGASKEELSKASAVSGVRDQADGSKGAGGTVSDLSARFSKETQNGACALIAVRVTVSIRQKLPRWTNAENAGDDARGWWRRFAAAIQEHEDGHKAIDEDSGQQLLDAIKEIPAQPSCDELDARVNAEIARAQSEQDARNAEYDRRTNHGRTQYAKYFGPPQ